MKIYTKTGDAGQTGLFGGPRVEKDDPRIAAYGEIDELNAVLGVVRTESVPGEIDEVLSKLQNQLFNVGAELATPEPAKHGTDLVKAEHIAWQEQTIDRLEDQLAPLTQFILPGGTRAAALLHLARCVCRRAERKLVSFAQREPVRAEVLAYLNRLSDLLFVLGRYANHAAEVSEVVWQKEE